jgi:hypothetical protein
MLARLGSALRLLGERYLRKYYSHCQFLQQSYKKQTADYLAVLTSYSSVMLLNSLLFPTGGQCTLTYEKADGWLRATWTGYINQEEAVSGALNYLTQVGPFHCLYLLNDSITLQGPWFDSTHWLKTVWLPQAQRLGLRYIAHVIQVDTYNDIMTLNFPLRYVVDSLELQLFHDITAAEEWLRSCQQPPVSAAQAGYPSLT